MKWIIGFGGVRQLVAGLEVRWKFGHMEEPIIVPVRLQPVAKARGQSRRVYVFEGSRGRKLGYYMVLNSIPGPGLRM